MIKEAVIHHDRSRYISHVCCIMPNHVHWILTPERQKGMTKLDSRRFIPIIQKFKSFTAHQANKILSRSGSFWSREYYDHRIRTSEEFNRLIQYTIQNPVKARLCTHWKDWPWTFCSKTLTELLAEAKLISCSLPLAYFDAIEGTRAGRRGRRRYQIRGDELVDLLFQDLKGHCAVS